MEINEQVRSEMDTLKDDLATLRRDMSEIVSTLKDIGKHRAGEVTDKAKAELDHRLQQLGEAYDAVKREGGRACDNLSHTVEERPLVSMAIAFAAGLVFGRIAHMSEK